jgi:hypothetical protein
MTGGFSITCAIEQNLYPEVCAAAAASRHEDYCDFDHEVAGQGSISWPTSRLSEKSATYIRKHILAESTVRERNIWPRVRRGLHVSGLMPIINETLRVRFRLDASGFEHWKLLGGGNLALSNVGVEVAPAGTDAN